VGASIKYTIAAAAYNRWTRNDHPSHLAFDSHGGLNFLASEAAPDLDESIGSISDEKAVNTFAVLLVHIPFWSAFATSVAVSSPESTRRTPLPMNFRIAFLSKG
jgi:hypothetical protein